MVDVASPLRRFVLGGVEDGPLVGLPVIDPWSLSPIRGSGRVDRESVALAVSRLRRAPVRDLARIAGELRGALRDFEDRRWIPAEVRKPGVWARFLALLRLRALPRSKDGRLAAPRPPEDWIADVADLAPLFVMHANGFYREAALRALSSVERSPFLLALVLTRTNDWVPQVRAAAAACLERVWPEVATADLVPLIPFVALRTTDWHRGKVSGDAPDGLPEMLLQGAGREAVVTYLLTVASGPVGQVCRRAFATTDFDGLLPRLATEAASPHVRQIACQTVFTGRASWVMGYRKEWIDKPMGVYRKVPDVRDRVLADPPAVGSVLVRALTDRARIERVSAVDALITRGPQIAPAEVVEPLRVDPSRTVRERMAFYDRKYAGAEPS